MDKPIVLEFIYLLFKCSRSLWIHAVSFLFLQGMLQVDIQCMARDSRRNPKHVRMGTREHIKFPWRKLVNSFINVTLSCDSIFKAHNESSWLIVISNVSSAGVVLVFLAFLLHLSDPYLY